ncbi:MAG TPA: DNA-binding protein WhiA [Candidatus Rubrimentiphilum sp.]|nr:DNA-binding protein WhiA [Candidatus Rubrimentiphilum sp.]
MNNLSADTKDALTRSIPADAHCREALLAGLALYGARKHVFVTHRNSVARLFMRLDPRHARSARYSGVLRQAQDDKKKLTPKQHLFRVAIPDDLRQLPRKPPRRCDRVMEARAAFLACGSLSAGAQGYHLEFVPPDNELGARLEWILRAVAAPPKRMRRAERSVLYYKDFEAIVELLGVIGAHAAVLHLEDVHALKETKNRIHRLVNTEAANLERVAGAAAAQRETIEFISSAHGLNHLSHPLREIAEMRLRHPDESLAELGRRCNPPISKPTVNSRLGALARLARRLRGETAPR